MAAQVFPELPRQESAVDPPETAGVSGAGWNSAVYRAVCALRQ